MGAAKAAQPVVCPKVLSREDRKALKAARGGRCSRPGRCKAQNPGRWDGRPREAAEGREEGKPWTGERGRAEEGCEHRVEMGSRRGGLREADPG